MSSLEQTLTELLSPPVEALGFELVGIEYIRSRNPILRVYIDKEGGVTVEDCADASYQISAVMDVEDPITAAYALEVSSPGLDRPLFTIEHYQRHIDQEIQLTLRIAVQNRRNWKGVLQKVDGEMISLLVDGQSLTVAFGNIQKGNLVYKF